VPDGVARGFHRWPGQRVVTLNRADLTDAAFVDDPFMAGRRMYRDSGCNRCPVCHHFFSVTLDRQVKECAATASGTLAKSGQPCAA
jgi:hypothetical protein